MDRDSGRLDPEQIAERQRVAPFLEREHDLAGAEAEQVGGQADDVVAVDRGGDRGRAVVHSDEADDLEIGAAAQRQRLDPCRPRAGAEHEDPPLEAARRRAGRERDPGADHRDQAEPHRVEQARPPEADRRKDEEDEAEEGRCRAPTATKRRATAKRTE